MAEAKDPLDLYLTGLRNRHAVETQAIGTLQNEMSYTTDYPELHDRMRLDKEQSTNQAARLDDLLGKHGTSKSLAKEAVAGAVATISGFAHVGAGDDVLKNVLAAIGFKAYEAASYRALMAFARAAGATDDQDVLNHSMLEEQEMGEWLDSYLPKLLQTYLSPQQP